LLSIYVSSIIHDRQRVVDSLLLLKKGNAPEEIHAKAAVALASGVRIKRYGNE
jgi:putative transposase